MTFTELGIDENIVQALHENNISRATDIQTQAIPYLLQQNTDLVAIAQTGTGKTAAFCLPILQLVDPKQKCIQALILVPTRELGQQVAREFFLFSKHMPRVFVEAVYGGVPIDEQIERLKRATHIVVATPGRLLDLLDRQMIDLRNLRFLVLDEADEMMNMGFKSEIDQILRSCKKGIRNMLFTATMSADIKEIISNYLQPGFKEILINAEEFVNRNIEHQYFIYKQGEKNDALKAFLAQRTDQRGILFCRTKTDAKRIAKQLAGFEVTAGALHGNLNQEMRDKVMRGFKKGRINLLVATDIAARGIDVKELDYIIHYHLPEKAEYYTHRSGRTARAGKSGISVCMIQSKDVGEITKLASELQIQFDEIKVEVEPQSHSKESIVVFVNLGFGQGFTRSNLAEFLVEEAGMNASDVKNVVVEDHHSSFEIPERYEKQLFINLKGYKIAHRNVKLTLG